MPLYTKLPEHLKEVDVIIAGGGLAGCVVASRLAEADRTLSILLIEQGPSSYNAPEVVHPALYPRNLFPSSKYTMFWQTQKSESLAGRSPIVPSGGTLGGGSAINWMVYTRAQRSDFDSWNTPGWTADEMMPFLKKLETYHPTSPSPQTHGTTGPIHISPGTHTCTRAQEAFLAASTALGYPEVPDLQNLDTNNAVQRYHRYVGPNGRRQDSAHRYLFPKLYGKEEDAKGGGRYENLHVLVEKQVVRVLFEEEEDNKGGPKRACAVEYQTNPQYLANPEFLATKYTARRRVGARKLVVLSAGANATPGILERSGIGSADVLRRAGVDGGVVVENDAVGEQYQDHHLSLWAYRTDLRARETINGYQDGRVDVAGAIRDGEALLGTNGMDVQGKLRPTEEEVDGLGSAFRKRWDEDFREKKDKPLMIVALYTCYYGDHSTLPEGAEYVSQANWTAYPYSRGSIHITGTSPADAPRFETGWLDDEGGVDLKKHVWAYKVTRDMWRRMPIFRGELAKDHPKFPEGSKAAVVEVAEGPLEKMDGPRMQYTEEDDRAIEQKVREVLSTTWHSLGTCKMAPREKGGVVDGELRVYGVEGLRCADLSIVPENVGANTGNTAFVVGEKAADLFIKQLGLGGGKSVIQDGGETVQARL